MKVSKWAALAGVVVVAGAIVPAGVARAQDRDTIVRRLQSGGGSRIGATVSVQDVEDNKDAKAGVSIETVEPGGPADKAGMKADDAVTEFDGERVRSVRQFLRLVQESTPGRSVQAVLTRDGKKVTVNVTPERSTFGDDFGMRFLDSPGSWPMTPPTPPPAPAAPRAPRPPAMLSPAAPYDFPLLRLSGRRLGVTIESLDSQLAEYFGVKEGVLVKSVAGGSSAQKAGLKAGDVITSVNGSHVYDTSDVNRAMDRVDDDAEFTLEIVRDKKTQTLKGKLEARDTRARTRIRTAV